MTTNWAACVWAILLLVTPSLGQQVDRVARNVVSGRLIAPGGWSPTSASLVLSTSDGQTLRTYCSSDGEFVFHAVPEGSHLLQAYMMGLYYPEVRVDVTSKHGVVRALYITAPGKQQSLPLPLVVRPATELHYFEKRKPLDLWSIIKSPYGIMIVFSVFAIVVFPRMKVDPEEYKEMQRQLGRASS